MALLYQKSSKSQAFLCFYWVSSTFYIFFMHKLCQLSCKILVACRLILRYVVSKSYICLHNLSHYVISCKNQLPLIYARPGDRFRPNFFPFDPGFSPVGDWLSKKNVLNFCLIKAVTEIRVPGKIPREEAACWKASVPLPWASPLPSRGLEIARRARPLTRQWVASLRGATRVEPWNTAIPVSHPWAFRGWVFFIPSPI